MDWLDVTARALKTILRNERYLVVFLGAAAGVVSSCLLGLYSQLIYEPQRTLTVRGLIVRDGGGNDRARLSVDADGSSEFCFLDKAGKTSAVFGTRGDGAAYVTLSSSDGVRRAELALREDGSPQLILRDNGGRNRFWLDTEADGSPHLLLSDKNAKVRVDLTTEGDGASNLLLYDENGRERIWLKVDSGGHEAFTLLNASGSPLARVVGTGDVSSLTLSESGDERIRLSVGEQSRGLMPGLVVSAGGSESRFPGDSQQTKQRTR